MHGEAGLTVESGGEADARADAEGVAEVAEEERPATGPARTGPATTEEAECAPDVDNSATSVGQGESVALGEDMGEGGGEGGANDPEGGTMGGGAGERTGAEEDGERPMDSEEVKEAPEAEAEGEVLLTGSAPVHPPSPSVSVKPPSPPPQLPPLPPPPLPSPPPPLPSQSTPCAAEAAAGDGGSAAKAAIDVNIKGGAMWLTDPAVSPASVRHTFAALASVLPPFGPPKCPIRPPRSLCVHPLCTAYKRTQRVSTSLPKGTSSLVRMAGSGLFC